MSRTLIESEPNHKKLVDDQVETISFSFKYFSEKKHGLDDCDAAELKALIKHLKKISAMTWNSVRNSHRHGLGSEKISGIKESVPDEFRGEQILAFRYNGKKPMVGIRRGSVFEILYVDTNFTLYDHE